MQKRVWIFSASILIAGTTQANYRPEQKKDQLEKDVLALQHNLKEIRRELAKITASAAELAFVIKHDAARLIREELSKKIDTIALQFDPTRPEPHLLKQVLEYLSCGRYQRPTGSLTPQAFRVLEAWLHNLTDWEVGQALVIVKEKINNNENNDQIKALKIIKEQIKFELDKREEDER